ncbi:MAG TPA: helicase-related protein, partial [Nitrospiraceae bacterium]|nr:helicase-related protein [Nitrospiraceae bacterium]
MFVLRGPAVPKLFQHVRYIVIDELHSFIGNERGRQLQSQLHRLELALRRKVPRVALSATLGDMEKAADFVRPRHGRDVVLVQSRDSGQEIRLQVRGYLRSAPRQENTHGSQELAETGDERAIGAHLFTVLRGHNNLVFCNARQSVEKFADMLRRLCEEQNVPNEFFPHHGNLSKEIREDIEKRLKSGSLPVTAVATTTLELGIDIGAVRSIAQIGPPISVSSMRQRLGRSGRRGEPAQLRCYIQESEITKNTSVLDSLRLGLFQTASMVNLLLRKWYEPPSDSALHLSTFIQQILSLIAQHGGVKPKEIYTALCSSGPFVGITDKIFGELLRSLSKHDLIIQSHDSTIALGLNGERLVNHYEFYTAFTTPEEYRITDESRDLGTLPLEHPVIPGQYLIFAGRRWEVLSVDDHKKLILVRQAAAGRLPIFGGTPGRIHRAIRQEMLRLYISDEIPKFMDQEAMKLFKEGRDAFNRLGLRGQRILPDSGDVLLFLWEGDLVVHTVAVLLAQRGIKTNVSSGVITLHNISQTAAQGALLALTQVPIDGISLASSVPNKIQEKHDCFLSEELMNIEFASRALDTESAFSVLSSHSSTP